MKTTSSERRLHPLSIVFEALRRLPGLLVPFVVLMFTRGGDGSAPFVLVIVGGVAVLLLLTSIARYLRYTYRYDAAELVIRSGVLFRNERSIPYVRIQNLDATQNLLHRVFGVTVVQVQTGGSAEPEASLRVLPMSALREMRERVLAAGGNAAPAADRAERIGTATITRAPDRSVGTSTETSANALDDTSDDTFDYTSDDAFDYTSDDTSASAEAPSAAAPSLRAAPRRTLVALTPRDLILAGFIENRGMVLVLGAFALLEQAGLIGNWIETLFDSGNAVLAGVTQRWLGMSGVPLFAGALVAAGAVLAILLFVRVLSTVWAVVRLYDFRLDRVGDDLHTEYGMFTRVSTTIPLRRVQTVVVRDRVLHRMLGRCTVRVETAGDTAGGNDARRREPIAPILRLQQLPALLHELQPGLDIDAAVWQPVHPRAFGRILRGILIWPLAVGAVTFFFVQAWAIPVFALLFTAAFGYARLRSRHLAWTLTTDSVLVRDGALTRTLRAARFNRIQVVALDRDPFDVRTGMSSVRADTAGARGGVVIPYLPQASAARLREQLSALTAGTPFTW